MTIKFIYKVIPILVFYTEWLSEWKSGQSYGVVIFIRPSEKNNDIILNHELIHCKQWYRTLGLHGILYYASKKWRLKSELEAYMTLFSHVGYQDHLVKRIAKRLYLHYNLDMSYVLLHSKAYDYYTSRLLNRKTNKAKGN